MRTSSLLAACLLLAPPAWGVPQSTPQGSGADETPAAEAPLKIPAEARNRPNPQAGDPEAIRHGAELFTTQCTMCHGAKGDGRGDLVERLGFRVPDFTRAEVQKARTDGEWFYIITVGHGDMQGEGERMPDEWKWDLVSYIRTLGPD